MVIKKGQGSVASRLWQSRHFPRSNMQEIECMASENPFCTFYSLYLFVSFSSFWFFFALLAWFFLSILSVLFALLFTPYPFCSFYPFCRSFLYSLCFSPLSAFLYPPYLHISSRSDPPRSSHFAFPPALTPSFGFIGYTSEESRRLLSNNLFIKK